MLGTGIPSYSEERRRGTSLVTPVTFEAALGTDTSLYTGKTGEFFLIRGFSASNTTGSNVSVSVTIGSTVWLASGVIPSNSVVALDGLEGQLVGDGLNITATGSGVTIFGWGLRIQAGSENWKL